MKSIIALKTGQRIDAALILGYYKHLLHLPQHFFDTMRVGEIISRVNDAVKIRNFINNCFHRPYSKYNDTGFLCIPYVCLLVGISIDNTYVRPIILTDILGGQLSQS